MKKMMSVRDFMRLLDEEIITRKAFSWNVEEITEVRQRGKPSEETFETECKVNHDCYQIRF